MNLPNKLTVMRMILIPFFVFFMLAPYFEGYGNYIATAIFIIASLTDMLDGKIARKYNLVTDFGKFMDPLADKLLVCSAMICLIEKGQLAAWIVIIIIAREFIISGFRLVAADNGIVIAASYWGKFPDAYGDRADLKYSEFVLCSAWHGSYIHCFGADSRITDRLYCQK